MSLNGVVAVDLGGTWIRAAAVAADGTLGPMVRRPTDRSRSGDSIVSDVASATQEAARWLSAAGGRCEGIAVGVPTTLNENGGLAESDNLPTMTDYPLERALRERLGLPVALFNDASCFAVGEWWMGTGRGARTVCGVTLGTGVGLGLVIAGRPYRGSHALAGEIWKAPLNRAVLEDSVSARALETGYLRHSGRRISGAEIAARADAGDAAARDTFERFGAALGDGLAWIAAVLDPEVIVLGGSIAASWEFFQAAMWRSLETHSVAGRRLKVLPTQLGEKAALLGAAWCFRHAGERPFQE